MGWGPMAPSREVWESCCGPAIAWRRGSLSAPQKETTPRSWRAPASGPRLPPVPSEPRGPSAPSCSAAVRRRTSSLCLSFRAGGLRPSPQLPEARRSANRGSPPPGPSVRPRGPSSLGLSVQARISAALPRLRSPSLARSPAEPGIRRPRPGPSQGPRAWVQWPFSAGHVIPGPAPAPACVPAPAFSFPGTQESRSPAPFGVLKDRILLASREPHRNLKVLKVSSGTCPLAPPDLLLTAG